MPVQISLASRGTAFITMAVLALFIITGCGGGDTSTCGTGTAPTVVSTVPGDGSVQISTATDIVVNFSTGMNIPSLIQNTTISPVAGSMFYYWFSNDTQMVIAPQMPLEANTVYTVTIGAEAMDQSNVNLAVPYVFSFETGDVAQAWINHPLYGQTNVSTATTISISFDEPMDTKSVQDNIGLSGYDGDVSFTWGSSAYGGSTVVSVQLSSPLATDRTYTMTISPEALDGEGTAFGVARTFVFSTGDQVAGGWISGTISDDPLSGYDDRVQRTYVALYEYDFTSGQGGAPVLAQCDLEGAYHFSFLNDGEYFLRAAQDTNGDGTVWDDGIRSGDATGYWPDLAAGPVGGITLAADSGTVAGFSLYDPEAISGSAYYAGLDTATAYSSLLFIEAFSGQGFLGTPVSVAEGSFDLGDLVKHWDYSVNPLIDDGLSLAPGNYRVRAFVDMKPNGVFDANRDGDGNWDDGEPVGFYKDPVRIWDAGDDVLGINLDIYDSITITGTVTAVYAASAPEGTGYEGAVVSLMGFPYSTVTDISGVYSLEKVPLGPEYPVRAQPADLEADGFLPTMTPYIVFDTGDALMADDSKTFDLPLVSTAVAESYGEWCAIERVKFTDALIAGRVVRETAGGEKVPVEGAKISFSGSEEVYYLDEGQGCSTASSTAAIAEGPQFIIFNACLSGYPDGLATISADDSLYPVGTVTIPLREGVLTWVELVYEP